MNNSERNIGTKIPVGIIGATGMVGQRFITLLQNHPWFEVVSLAASSRSADRPYTEAVAAGRWVMREPVPESVANINVLELESNIDVIANQVGLVFSALDLDKETICNIENDFASREVAVVSNNSAHRWTEDVPMVIPEINPDHLDLIDVQRRNHGWNRGLVVVKPNCSIQSYVPLITPLLDFGPTKMIVVTFQAVSGAGRILAGWPEMQGNDIPFIAGEEEKSEREPLKVWGEMENDSIRLATSPVISAFCSRVPVEDGHTAFVEVSFTRKPIMDEIIEAWRNFNPLRDLNLSSSPSQFITFMEEADRPQVRLDVMVGNGMGISVGRLRESSVLDYKFVGLSHNTIRGAAGGAILTAELLKVKGYL